MSTRQIGGALYRVLQNVFDPNLDIGLCLYIPFHLHMQAYIASLYTAS